MKVCTVCKIEKDEECFNWKNKALGKRQSSCRQCTKEQVDGSRKNPDGSIKRKYSYPAKVKERKQANIRWFQEYKATLSCQKCGFSHPAVLDFDHRDPNQKIMEVGTLVSEGYSLEVIEAEIAKCDVLCSNCHRIRHYEERLALVRNRF